MMPCKWDYSPILQEGEMRPRSGEPQGRARRTRVSGLRAAQQSPTSPNPLLQRAHVSIRGENQLWPGSGIPARVFLGFHPALAPLVVKRKGTRRLGLLMPNPLAGPQPCRASAVTSAIQLLACLARLGVPGVVSLLEMNGCAARRSAAPLSWPPSPLSHFA